MRRQLAALAAVILPATACGSLTTAHPAIGKGQAERVLANYQAVNNRANGALDGDLLGTIETGAQLEMDRAGYRLREAKKGKYAPFIYSHPAYYIPRQDSYPKCIALDTDGFATAVSPADTNAALPPRNVAGTHAATLSSGAGGMAPGPYTSDSRDALTKVQSALQRRGVTLTSDFAPDQQRTYALRTTGGGALVWYVVRQSERYDMAKPGTVSTDGDLAGLVSGRVGHHLSSVALIQYLAIVPDHGDTQVIGTYRKAVQATTS